MKKFFQTIGMIALISFSFFFTEKTVSVVKEQDSLLINIRKVKDEYKIEAKDAIVKGNTIIPGLNGKVVDENASYNAMKKIGTFTPSMLVYDVVKPNIKATGNYDKYFIGGNKAKKMVALIFLLEDGDNPTKILETLNAKNVTANFFIDGNWLEKNSDKIKAIGEKHGFGNLSYNGDYSNSSFVWINTVLKKYSDGNIYCYGASEDSNTLKLCALKKNYTVMPSITAKEPYKDIKEKLTSGSIIALNINEKVENQLPAILNLINSKGYTAVNLTTLLSEDLYN